MLIFDKINSRSITAVCIVNQKFNSLLVEQIFLINDVDIVDYDYDYVVVNYGYDIVVAVFDYEFDFDCVDVVD